MTNLVILGTQWGDEGKGKIVDALAAEARFVAVVRYQGGNNAGHTVVVNNQSHAFHLLPSGVLYPDKTCVIGNGVVIDPLVLRDELVALESRLGSAHARLLISDKAHLILPWHVLRDRLSGGAIGTTGRGIGPAYMDYVGRRGIRWGDTKDRERFGRRVAEEAAWNRAEVEALLGFYQVPREKQEELTIEAALSSQLVLQQCWPAIEALRNNATVSSGDAGSFLDEVRQRGGDILFEGAQATLLDIAHGTYPYVTSSHPTLGGVYVGTGIRPDPLKVLGVAKAYTTRVGAGPFPTELDNELGSRIRELGHEYGTTTGRPRRCGWLDLTILRYARRVNGLDALALTKLDVLAGLPSLRVAVAYRIGGGLRRTFTVDEDELAAAEVVFEELEGWEGDLGKARRFADLPAQARTYVQLIEDEVGIPVEMISTGPGREQLLRK